MFGERGFNPFARKVEKKEVSSVGETRRHLELEASALPPIASQSFKRIIPLLAPEEGQFSVLKTSPEHLSTACYCAVTDPVLDRQEISDDEVDHYYEACVKLCHEDDCRTRATNDSRWLYVDHFSGQSDNAISGKIYLNLDITKIPEALPKLLGLAKVVPHLSFKTLFDWNNPPRIKDLMYYQSGRRDKVPIYVDDRKSLPALFDYLQEFQSKHPEYFHNNIPLFSSGVQRNGKLIPSVGFSMTDNSNLADRTVLETIKGIDFESSGIPANFPLKDRYLASCEKYQLDSAMPAIRKETLEQDPELGEILTTGEY